MWVGVGVWGWVWGVDWGRGVGGWVEMEHSPELMTPTVDQCATRPSKQTVGLRVVLQ